MQSLMTLIGSSQVISTAPLPIRKRAWQIYQKAQQDEKHLAQSYPTGIIHATFNNTLSKNQRQEQTSAQIEQLVTNPKGKTVKQMSIPKNLRGLFSKGRQLASCPNEKTVQTTSHVQKFERVFLKASKGALRAHMMKNKISNGKIGLRFLNHEQIKGGKQPLLHCIIQI